VRPSADSQATEPAWIDGPRGKRRSACCNFAVLQCAEVLCDDWPYGPHRPPAANGRRSSLVDEVVIGW
jgi:hypothetical protein